MEYAAIFDLDGVLIDSYNAIWDSHNEALGQHGVHLNERDIPQYCGKSLRDNIELWNRKYELNLSLETHRKESWKIQFEILKGISVDAGLVKFLDDLKKHGIPMGVGTSSEAFRCEEILKVLKIKNYFSAIVTANDVALHKPNPDVFLEVARRLKAVPAKSVVFEDAGNGIEAAKRGGMKTVGYLNEHNSVNELCNADLVIRSFSEVSYQKIARMFEQK